MHIEPKIRGYICTTAHPEGCIQNVQQQIQYVSNQPSIASGPKKVLIIGASTGYGLASRIVAAFGAKAQTIGVFLERTADDKRTASAGWYHTAAFEQAANQAGIYAKSINGDAFSDAIKQETIALIKEDWGGEVDLVIYSLASPRRTHPQTGISFKSCLKPIGEPYRNQTIDIISGHLSDACIEPATPKEVADTVAVMGGEDWMMWIEALLAEKLLAKRVQTIAYSYIGPKLTHRIYAKGTIGMAKKDLVATSKMLQYQLRSIDGQAFIAVSKAVVTQGSIAIPVVPLYIALLYKVMKEKQLHEGCIEQMYRLYADRLYRTDQKVLVDAQGLIRIDDWEMREDVQEAVAALWSKIDEGNLTTVTDWVGCRHEFYKLFGFEVEGVDYSLPQMAALPIPSLDLPI
ncbi:enoyl-ACP reductase FabV [Cardinium endosymbiont of Bemisia tabaci]|uniref:enoyl-ACP reductase FabV n=1 Tax=Cardinium endosymbiont of Bemisia tabaci TaxID=672794 RepID=UPI000442D0FD|nr:enoyl-ACP reductase FabV [Cardinium endosymbiont of Bemisia tabaci]CDG49358.1 Enoyl-[acyl-carrier protein] reductase [Cardinium endosymbiont cBtQ1 of Bemisia tabaci]